MENPSKLNDLLLQWEEMREQGRALAVEELCALCPELLDEAKRQINALRAMDRLLAPAQKPSSAEQSSPSPAVNAPVNGFLRSGRELVPGYRLISKLGQGGYGEVWKAETSGGFLMALKIVPLAEQSSGGELRALDIVKGIRHPNLVSIHDAWQIENRLIIAMDLGDRTLWDRFQEAIRQGLPGIPRDELLEYIREAAKGIDFLNQPRGTGVHDRPGVQHRDIKPQNILLVGGGVKVADFGLARALERTFTGHTGPMTPQYAPPEFFDGKTAAQSDQYSLAATYCHLRGGRPPFVGSQLEVMKGHASKPPDLSMLPEEERAAVWKALAKSPQNRWGNCAEFVAALSASCPENDCSIARRPSTPRRWLIAVLVSGLAVATVCAWIFVHWIGLRNGEISNPEEGVATNPSRPSLPDPFALPSLRKLEPPTKPPPADCKPPLNQKDASKRLTLEVANETGRVLRVYHYPHFFDGEDAHKGWRQFGVKATAYMSDNFRGGCHYVMIEDVETEKLIDVGWRDFDWREHRTLYLLPGLFDPETDPHAKVRIGFNAD